MTERTRLLILGGGTAGTMVANKVTHELPDWQVTVVDQNDIHDYQPGYLFVPFGMNTPEQIRKTKSEFISDKVTFLQAEVDRVDPETKQVMLADGQALGYDYLVIASGTTPRPEETPGVVGEEWRKSIHEFYTYDGSIALRDALQHWTGGRLVVHITELPIKCPVAPLEFTFLADDWLSQHGLRDATDLVFVTPLDSAFTKPIAARATRPRVGRPQGHRRDRLHDRVGRPGAEGPGVLRRARDRLRPARHRPAQHGRRLRRPLRPR
ncbi:MAG: FAD-dependent oxidoreductase [Nocardioides sp.]